MKKQNIAIFWMRRDLRFDDNTALYHAISSGHAVMPIFIFDENILNTLEDKDDARVTFIYETVNDLKSNLQKYDSDLLVFYGKPENIFQQILEEYNVHSVFTNRDYEPSAIDRDEKIKSICHMQNVAFHTYKDHVIFDTNEVVKDDGKPYTVFTPYKKKWLAKFESEPPVSFDTSLEYIQDKLYKFSSSSSMPTLDSMGFVLSNKEIPPLQVSSKLISVYDRTRDFPALDATSKLGIHFRFGTISIRQKARAAAKLNQTYLSELIWRDFYSMILWHFPHVAKNSFRKEYDGIAWENDENKFDAWCAGKTGYPMVDAGMRQLTETGYMHNRVRMVTASFLTKHLRIDWRWGEAWFARHLLDFDLASNNGGWQWAAGCGTDAAPYFRIFNPQTQLEKFDKNLEYVKKWIPEFGTALYPKPIVDHKAAREKCLKMYKAGLKE